MKQGILIVSLFIAGIFVSHGQEVCDTLKWKTINTYYGIWSGSNYNRIGNLDSAIINTDTLPIFAPRIYTVNISNDHFSANCEIGVILFLMIYTDTGFIASIEDAMRWTSIGREVSPNDTLYANYVKSFNLLDITNNLKEVYDIELEQVSYWELTMGIYYTSKDGIYSEDVFYAGADTATFYVVRGGVGVQEIEQKASVVSVYPNPAATQLHVERDNYPSLQTDYVIYNIMGQTVLQGKLQESAIINIESLAKGMYYLRISNTTVKFVKD